MSYTLNGITIRAPKSIEETNSTQFTQQKTLSGAVGRDYFGSNKRIWTLTYNNVNKTDFTTINTIYQGYLNTGIVVSFASTESNYTISATDVFMDLTQRNFNVPGTDYISDFNLVLTEA